MGLKGVIINQIVIKCGGDVFHELVRQKPHNISAISPEKIHGCELIEGQWGTIGAVISWTHTHDGKKKTATERITAIDEEKKSVTFKTTAGNLMGLYKSFMRSVLVETHGENNLVIWTFEYEKLNENIPYPTSQMDFCLHLTKDIESHCL